MQKKYKLNDFEKEILQYKMQNIFHPRIWNEEESKPIWWKDKGGTAPNSDQILQLQIEKDFNDYNSSQCQMQKSISKTCWRGVETYLMRRQRWNCSSLWPNITTH